MKAIIFLAEGFETCEAMITLDLLKRAKIETDTCSVTFGNEVVSAHDVRVITDRVISDIDFDDYDCLVLPGGMPGTLNLQSSELLREMILDFNEKKKLICAICAAPSILGELGLLKDKFVTCYPGFEDKCIGAIMSGQKVVKDGNIITSKAMGTTFEFAREIISTLQSTEKAEEVLAAVYY